MRTITAFSLVLAMLICSPRDINSQELQGAIHGVDDCCNIVSVDHATKQIVVRETATGRTKTLTIGSAQLLKQLKPGAAVGKPILHVLRSIPAFPESGH